MSLCLYRIFLYLASSSIFTDRACECLSSSCLDICTVNVYWPIISYRTRIILRLINQHSETEVTHTRMRVSFGYTLLCHMVAPKIHHGFKHDSQNQSNEAYFLFAYMQGQILAYHRIIGCI